MYYIGYDIGSSSVKIALVDAESQKALHIINEPQTEMPIKAIQLGWAEQNPLLWWKHICEGTKRIIAEAKIDSKKIKAIGISYQMHGLVVLDKEKKLLRDSIIWCDSRAVSIGEKAAEDLGETKYGTQLLNAPGNFTASKLKWVKENEPSLYDQIAYYMLPGDYIAFQLSGEIATTTNSLSEGTLWDFKHNEVANWLLEYYGIDPALTPTLVDNFSDQCSVSKSGADATGLPIDIPIRYRAGDQPNNALALNILQPGEVAATGGTSGVLFAVTDQPNAQEYHKYNHFAHVNYTIDEPRLGKLLCINGAGIQYSWLRKITQENEFSEMNSLANTAPIGCDGLVNLSFGNGAERMFNNKNIGAHLMHLNLNKHSRGHLYRAALEGVAFAFFYGLEIMIKDGLPINIIRAGNDNLFRSELFSNTLATLVGHEIEIYDTTGAVGAARAAGIEQGKFEDFQERTNSLDRETTFSPEQQKEPYLEAYARWKETLQKIINQ
tara:strand:- start:677 stop:2158 length:1482 start_codon:yes stop_codon:yes gene_type:complete